MKRKKFFKNSVRFVQALRLWRPQWKRRMALAVALLLPGIPHIFGKKHFYAGCCLCLFGIGALLSLSISVVISGSMIQTFDAIYTMGIANFEMLYPLDINPSVASSENLTPIQPEGEPLFIQPFYRELWYTCIILYVVCAMISFRYQWKAGQVRS